MTIRKRDNAWYGWRPQLPDKRDHVFGVAKPLKTLPKSVDQRALHPPIYDQGNLGSCTANAIADVLEFDRMKQKLPVFVPSRLFIYYEERRIEGTIREDAGAELRDGIKVVAKLGAPDEKLWPYVVRKFATAPPKSVYGPALDTQAIEYAAVPQTLNALKQTLAAGFPIVFGFTVYESFESAAVARTGIVPMPKHSEAVLGGHAVVLVGYTDANSRFIVRNSWATDWGAKGYMTMPYQYVTDSNLSSDFWVVRSVG